MGAFPFSGEPPFFNAERENEMIQVDVLYGSTFIDEQDLPLIQKYVWRFHKVTRGKGYVLRYNPDWYKDRSGLPKTIYLHREIMGFPEGLQIDHVDGDTLNNTRVNLRVVSNKQNSWNCQKVRVGSTSQYRGVSWNKTRKKWTSAISIEGRTRHIGYFDDEAEAARARDVVALEVRGEFAVLNFPKEE